MFDATDHASVFDVAHAVFEGDLVAVFADPDDTTRAVVVVKRRDPFGHIIPERPFAAAYLLHGHAAHDELGPFQAFTDIDAAVGYAIGYSGHYQRNASV